MTKLDDTDREIISILRADARTNATPVVVVTADATEVLSRRLLDQGAQRLLVKPFELAELRVGQAGAWIVASAVQGRCTPRPFSGHG